MLKVTSGPAGGPAPDQQAVYHTGVWAPPKLLAEAKSDENERRLRVGDLARPGPMARRILLPGGIYFIARGYLF